MKNKGWEIEMADFRQGYPERTVHHGKPIIIRVCEELVDGRWEGFVSIQAVR